eukprot:6707281-Prymnesium_polylepis.1
MLPRPLLPLCARPFNRRLPCVARRLVVVCSPCSRPRPRCSHSPHVAAPSPVAAARSPPAPYPADALSRHAVAAVAAAAAGAAVAITAPLSQPASALPAALDPPG